MKWRMEPVQPWVLIVGLMTHCFNFQGVATIEHVACVATSVWLNACNYFSNIIELAKGVDHHVRLFAATAAIEKNFR